MLPLPFLSGLQHSLRRCSLGEEQVGCKDLLCRESLEKTRLYQNHFLQLKRVIFMRWCFIIVQKQIYFNDLELETYPTQHRKKVQDYP